MYVDLPDPPGLTRAAGAFDSDHSFHAAQRFDYLLEVLEIVDLDGHVDPRVRALVRARFHVLDVGVDVGNLRADRGEHALPILDLHRQLDGVAGDRIGLVPFDVDAPLGIVEQVHDVGAGRGVDRHALAARDVADDLLAADRIAAAGAEHHQIVEAADLDLLFAGAEHAPHDG